MSVASEAVKSKEFMNILFTLGLGFIDHLQDAVVSNAIRQRIRNELIVSQKLGLAVEVCIKRIIYIFKFSLHHEFNQL